MDTLYPQPPPADDDVEPSDAGAPAAEERPERPLDRVWNVLPRDFVRDALERSLEEALGPHEESLGSDAVTEAKREASRQFLRAARQRARRVRGTTRSQVLAELQESHRELLVSRDETKAELQDLESRTTNLRTNLEAVTPQLDEADQRRLDEDQEADLRLLLKGFGRKPNKRTDLLVQELLELSRQRQVRAMTVALAAYPERIATLERRMAKLKVALWRTEKALKDLSGRALTMDGKASIFRDVQGLGQEDPMFRAKSGALRTIFEENKRLRNNIATG